MHILKVLSEEIFDFSKGQMTQAKVAQLKESFTSEFAQIFELCNWVLESAASEPLVLVTLQTLLRFLSWIPLGYVFETNLVESLLTRFLTRDSLRNITTECLTEIVSLTFYSSYNKDTFKNIYVLFLQQLVKIVPPDANIAEAYDEGSMEEQDFINDLAMFLCAFFSTHRSSIEGGSGGDLELALLEGHSYLCKISQVDNVEVFKVCLEYWHDLANDLFSDGQGTGYGGGVLGGSGSVGGLMLGNGRGQRRQV